MRRPGVYQRYCCAISPEYSKNYPLTQGLDQDTLDCKLITVINLVIFKSDQSEGPAPPPAKRLFACTYAFAKGSLSQM